ncbi:MAG: hypothetical protein KGJ86_09120 [Chloroflexota bacterium]|nr:hypothetical protein [Chloroflexota bacterium]
MSEVSPSTDDPTIRVALGLLDPPSLPDPNRALSRQLALQGREALETPATARRSFMHASYRFLSITRPALAIPLAAALVLALGITLTPVKGLAAQFLTIFRVQELTPVTIPPGSPLPDLSKLGDMQAESLTDAKVNRVDSLAKASSAVGFSVQTPTVLPAGLPTQPAAMAVTPGRTMGFTFRATKAQAYLASIGHADFSMPAKFDGASLQLHMEPAAIIAYLPTGTKLSAQASTGAGQEEAARALLSGGGVVLAETKSPTVDATGMSADELRNFLLSLPGLPQSTVAQLRVIGDWRTTLPIPVGPDANLQKTQVNGASAVAGTNMGKHLNVWVKDGVVYAAAGATVSDADLARLAASVK